MKSVYKCEFCDEISEKESEILEHEKICGYNPKNEINDEVVLKLSRLFNHMEESLIYVLIMDHEKNIDFYRDEFERATKTNCPASIYENKENLSYILTKAKRIRREKDFNWFMNITRRDNPEFIQAIITYLREPEYRNMCIDMQDKFKSEADDENYLKKLLYEKNKKIKKLKAQKSYITGLRDGKNIIKANIERAREFEIQKKMIDKMAKQLECLPIMNTKNNVFVLGNFEKVKEYFRKQVENETNN